MSVFRRHRAEISGEPGPVDVLQRDSRVLRRWIVAAGCGAVLLLAGISIVLAWQQYDDAKQQARDDLRARAVAVAALVDTSFTGQIQTLTSIAEAPSVVQRQLPRMQSYFRRVGPPGSPPFTGGIGWIDRSGMVRATNTAGPPVGSLSSREYFRRVVATHKPYVSAGLLGKKVRQPVIVVAVPTFGPGGDFTGALAGSILLKTVAESRQALALGYGNLQLVDRNGQLLLGGLSHVTNTALLGRIRGNGTGVVSGRGLDGSGGHVVAFAAAGVPGWVTAIDRSRSSVYASARRALFLELGSVLAAVLLVLAILVLVTRRARREAELYNERARAWSSLGEALASASTPTQVGDALLVSLSRSFPNAVAIVGIESHDRLQIRAASRMVRARRITESARILELAAPLGLGGPRTVSLEHEPDLRDLYTKTGRGMRAVHGLPISGSDEKPAGTISLLSTAAYLESHDWAVLRSFADQAARALERAWRFVQEHDLSVRLQRSLLPERLPSSNGIELAGHYRAGADAVEVGGDWYDAVRRPDGTVHLCVGDVSGKGIGAATVMSRQRHTFQVYAHDLASPAEIIRRMLRHADGEEMITVAVVTLDPYAGELRYSCVGHPPPLLLDRDSGEVTRLDGASAPPVGVAVPLDIVEATLPLPDRAALLLYTDGLIERRGRNIEDAIALLGRVLQSEPVLTPDAILATIVDSIGSPDDDVALLLLTLDGRRLSFDVELPADAAALRDLRRRLRTWLAHHGIDSDEAAGVVLAVSEACNNAIEHAYGDNGGGPVKVSLEPLAEEGVLRILVEDHGTWREDVPSADRGRGIGLMEHLMHTTDIQTGLHGTRVTLERRLRIEPSLAPDHARATP
jgi:serine phosphatase RsbU (regulator of sigma subunit)/anti-sigma regulatory factor (Ser/Thr protein kinase)